MRRYLQKESTESKWLQRSGQLEKCDDFVEALGERLDALEDRGKTELEFGLQEVDCTKKAKPRIKQHQEQKSTNYIMVIYTLCR